MSENNEFIITPLYESKHDWKSDIEVEASHFKIGLSRLLYEFFLQDYDNFYVCE